MRKGSLICLSDNRDKTSNINVKSIKDIASIHTQRKKDYTKWIKQCL